MSTTNRRYARTIVAALAATACALVSACPTPYQGAIDIESRVIRVDLPDVIFNPFAASAPATVRGVGAISAVVTVTTDADSYEAIIGSGGLDAVYDYTQAAVTVTGRLVSVSVAVSTVSGQTFTAELDDWKDGSAYAGWTTFANVRKFRLCLKPGVETVTGSALSLEPGPRGGVGLRLLYDNHATDPDFAYTDRGQAAALGSGVITVQPVWLENPAGLSYDVHSLVVNENLQALYDPLYSSAAEYWPDAWTGSWTVDEIRSATGKSVAGSKVALVRQVTNLSAVNPLGDGNSSYRFSYPAYVGKYLVVALVVTDGQLSVPTQAVVIPIE